jgi:hypothetical protein
MGLINLKTDLKSLRYGNDRIGGADSGQPYITTAIPDRIGPYIGTTDFLLRGGINAVRDTATDVQRLAKMFNDTKSPNGILFTAKQQLLSQTAVRTQTSGILNEGTYTPLNTLAEAGVVAFGGHLVKQGLNPFADTGAYANNENLYDWKVNPFKNPDLNGILGIGENRLVRILNSAIEFSSAKVNNITYNKGSNFINILSYPGGPNSILGEGFTNIRSQSIKNRTLLTVNSSISNFSTKTNAWSYSSQTISTPYVQDNEGDLADGLSPVGSTSISSPNIQDFRVALRSSLNDQTRKSQIASLGIAPEAPNYFTKNFELRTNLGQPGQRAGKSYANYTKGVEGTTGTGVSNGQSVYPNITIPGLGSSPSGLDKINSVPIYRSEQASTDSQLTDLVDFRIAIIDNSAPAFKTFLHFRAFLGGMSDAYQAEWTPFKYLGRGENFYTYNGFTRQMSLSWTVAAQSKEELIPMYKKLNYLASTLAPDYSPQGYMRGNIAQLTVGGYVYEQPGIITGLTYDIQEDSPWEIGINVTGGIDETVRQLPHIIRVSSFNFIPIQKFLPKKQSLTFTNNPNDDVFSDNQTGFVNGYSNQSFISLENKDGNLYGTDPFADATLIKQNNAGLINAASTAPSFTPPEFSIGSNFIFP